MLMVIAGAGASFDSIPSRRPSVTQSNFRPPLADDLFTARPAFEEAQRQIPQIMPVVPALQLRRPNESVEDVLARFAMESVEYPHRRVQLAAIRFYLQAVIASCEEEWYRKAPLATNMMALVDQIECARHLRERPIFVTFNYDRLIENALSNRGQSFASLADYCREDKTSVFKLHGSVDWARPTAPPNPRDFGGSQWDIARQTAEAIAELPEPGPISHLNELGNLQSRQLLGVPAIAVPLKEKSAFECPEQHLHALRSRLSRVRAIVTIGWRGAEGHFLRELTQHCRQAISVICVGGSVADATETADHLNGALSRAAIATYGDGFTSFVQEGGVGRLLNLAWE